jgi:hypothetical protein
MGNCRLFRYLLLVMVLCLSLLSYTKKTIKEQTHLFPVSGCCELKAVYQFYILLLLSKIILYIVGNLSRSNNSIY